MTRGRLVVLEGPEGAGKTTQIGHLLRRLGDAGLPRVSVQEPGQTAVGAAVRNIVLDPLWDLCASTEALLFMASRAELVEREVLPALAAGTHVIADRFFLSTYAYQIAGRGLPEDDVRAANRLATSGLVPDLTILLDLPSVEGLTRAAARAGHDRIEQSGNAFHQRVAAAFSLFALDDWQQGHLEAGPIVTVDARGSEAQVTKRLVTVLAHRWPETFASLQGSH